MPVHRSILRKFRKKAMATACRENYKKIIIREKKKRPKKLVPSTNSHKAQVTISAHFFSCRQSRVS